MRRRRYLQSIAAFGNLVSFAFFGHCALAVGVLGDSGNKESRDKCSQDLQACLSQKLWETVKGSYVGGQVIQLNSFRWSQENAKKKRSF